MLPWRSAPSRTGAPLEKPELSPLGSQPAKPTVEQMLPAHAVLALSAFGGDSQLEVGLPELGPFPAKRHLPAPPQRESGIGHVITFVLCKGSQSTGV